VFGNHLSCLATQDGLRIETEGIVKEWHFSPDRTTNCSNFVDFFWEQIWDDTTEVTIKHLARKVAVTSEVQEEELSVRVAVKYSRMGVTLWHAANRDRNTQDLVPNNPELSGGH